MPWRASWARAASTAALLTLAFAWSSAGHALPQTSEPASGSNVAVAPTQVVITFGETPDPKLSRIDVLDVNGRSVAAGPAAPVPGNAAQLAVPLGPLPDGVYTVSWRTVSAVDGHLASGSFAFGVGANVAAPGLAGGLGSEVSSPLSPAAVAGRWLLYLGLIGMLGACFVALVVTRIVNASTLPLSASCWAFAALGTAIVIGAQMGDAGVSLDEVLSTSLGGPLLARSLPILVAAGGILALWQRPSRARVWLIVVAAGAAVAMLADVLDSHAAAQADPTIAVAEQWLHILAAGTWLGGLVALLFTVRGAPRETTGRIVRCFATAAGLGLAVVILTGILRAVTEVGSIDGLLSTDFGHLIIAKSSLLVVLAGLGTINHFHNVPRAAVELRGLRRVGSTEVTIGVVVLLLTAGLVNLAPPASAGGSGTGSSTGTPNPSGSPATGSVVAAGSDFGTSVRVELTVSPGSAGFNSFVLQIADYDTGAPVSGADVTLRFSLPARPSLGGSRLDLQAADPGTYRATGGNLSIAGSWKVTAVIVQGSASVEVPLVVRTVPPQQAVDVQVNQGLPTIYNVHLVSGGTLQVYVDPGTAGQNEIHSTFFDPAGNELPVTRADISLDQSPVASPGPVTTLDARMLEPGHFVADTTLPAGGVRVLVTGAAPDGSYLAAEVEMRIGP